MGVWEFINRTFKIYENLYSQHNLGEDFDKVQLNIQERVHHGLHDDIDKVNHLSVKHSTSTLYIENSAGTRSQILTGRRNTFILLCLFIIFKYKTYYNDI